MSSPDPTQRRLGFLFLGGAKRLTMARCLTRAAAAHGYRADIMSYELTAEEPIAAIGRVATGLRWSDPAVETDIVELMHRNDLTVLLPFVDGATVVAADIAASHPDFYCPCSSPSLTRDLFDKVSSAKLFELNGLDIPHTFRSGMEPVFPLIAKPRFGSASAGIRILRDRTDLDTLPSPADYLIQEYISGADEYTVDCFVDSHGRPTALSGRRRALTLGGEVVRTVTVDIPALTEASRLAATRLGLRGAFTLQYLHSNGRFLLMEINPRLGGGATASVSAGADIASMIVEEATGMVVAERRAVAGAVTTRCFQDVTFLPGNQVINI